MTRYALTRSDPPTGNERKKRREKKCVELKINVIVTFRFSINGFILPCLIYMWLPTFFRLATVSSTIPMFITNSKVISFFGDIFFFICFPVKIIILLLFSLWYIFHLIRCQHIFADAIIFFTSYVSHHLSGVYVICYF